MPNIETTVLGGLPVTIAFTMQGAEPDVGIMSRYVDSWHITHIGKRKANNPKWLYKRITESEEQRIIESCYNSI